MSSMIGIKVADGGFFPIVAENVNARKRLVLTTAHDDQSSVQIDFYKSSLHSMEDAVYIGTLLLENISKKDQGSTSIELIVSSNEKGEFSASAYDLEQPDENGRHILAGSLMPLENSENLYDDIDLDHEDILIKESYSDKYYDVIKFSKSKLLMVIIPLIAIIAVGLYFFVFRTDSSKAPSASEIISEAPPVETIYEEPPPPLPSEEEAEAAAQPVETPPPVIKEAPEAPVMAPARLSQPGKRDPAPVFSYKMPAVIPAGGLTYRLRWGDTLWDVSQAFYRTPWRYNYLARYNGIRNANHVVSGRTIVVPPLPK
jgi:hypothetical protein